jgi:ketosteroid isomerase-like protein
MEHITTTQEIYAAFGRGDIPAILAHLADDVVFEPWPHAAQRAGVPWMQRREGRHGAADFFASLAGLEFHSFEPRNFLAGGDQVAVVVRAELTALATGRRITDEEIHLWTFDEEGRVSEMRHFADTAEQIAAVLESAVA